MENQSSDPVFWAGGEIAITSDLLNNCGQRANLPGGIGMQVGQKRGGSKIDLCILKQSLCGVKKGAHIIPGFKLLGNFPL